MSFSAIGTTWSIDTKIPVPEADWARLEADVMAAITSFDRSFSRFRKDSWVSEVANHPGRWKLPPYAYMLLRFYEKLYRATDGLVTPLIGRVMEDVGYDATYSLRSHGELAAPPSWEEAIEFNTTYVTTTQPVLLDFGAAGKGYLVDILAGMLEEQGLNSYVINAGGDIRQRDAERETITVGLENPFDTTEVIGTLELENRSLAASAGSRRTWETFHHIINPRTLKSPRDIAASWVTATDTMTADGIATALFMVPAQTLQRDFTFEYTVLGRDMGVAYSPNFPAHFNEAARL